MAAEAKGRLVPVSGLGGAGSEVRLLAERVTLGRAPGNVVVLDDREVSKFHAEIVADDNGFVLCDLGSSNGTLVNGKAVTKHRLSPGDIIAIGSSNYRFELGDSSGVGAGPSVSIAPRSPVDRTTVIAATQLEALVPGRDIKDLDNLRRSYDRVRAAFEAVQVLLTTTDLPMLCEKILEVTFQLLDAENGAVLLFDEKRELVPWAHKSRGPVGRIVVSRTIVDEVVRRRAAVLATDALTDARFGTAQSVVMSGLRSLMCVPLISGERIYGLLHVGNSKEVGAYTPADLELVSGIGTGAGVALANAFLAQQLADEARARESLGRFLSPGLVECVLQQGLDLKRGGNETEVTVMFADIRGFTSLTERSRALDVFELLNEYFDQMVEVVFRHGGTLDKFIGDALMAVWGAPVAERGDAGRAIAAAQEMQVTLTSLNAFRTDRGQDPIEIGVGLASGRCVAGAIGARRRMEYTVIGDAVNLASRLAGMAAPGQVLCDEESYARAGRPKETRALPPAQVKGKTKPVAVYELWRKL